MVLEISTSTNNPLLSPGPRASGEISFYPLRSLKNGRGKQEAESE